MAITRNIYSISGGSFPPYALYVYRGVGAGERSVEMLMTSLIRAVPNHLYRVIAISPEDIIKGKNSYV